MQQLRQLVDVLAFVDDDDRGELRRLAARWGIERGWSSTLAVADWLVRGDPEPRLVGVWARYLRELREPNVLEMHVQEWLSPFWLTTPRPASRRAFHAVLRDLQTESRTRPGEARLRQTIRALTHPRSLEVGALRPVGLPALRHRSMEAPECSVAVRAETVPPSGTSPPAFTVVMPAHDNAATIGEAIESVRRQTRSDWELIVVDDGSSDGTAEVAEAFDDPRIRVVRQAENRGPGSSAQSGHLARAGTARLPPRQRRPLAAAVSRDDGARARRPIRRPPSCARTRGCSTRRLGESGRRPRWRCRIRRSRYPTTPQTFLVELLRRNFIYYSVAARRESILAVGGYDERLWIGEDWELWLRLAAAGFRFRLSSRNCWPCTDKRAGSLYEQLRAARSREDARSTASLQRTGTRARRFAISHSG